MDYQQFVMEVKDYDAALMEEAECLKIDTQGISDGDFYIAANLVRLGFYNNVMWRNVEPFKAFEAAKKEMVESINRLSKA